MAIISKDEDTRAWHHTRKDSMTPQIEELSKKRQEPTHIVRGVQFKLLDTMPSNLSDGSEISSDEEKVVREQEES